MLDYAFWIMVAYAIIVCGGIVFINWYTTRNNKYPGRNEGPFEGRSQEPDQERSSASDALSNIRKFWSN